MESRQKVSLVGGDGTPRNAQTFWFDAQPYLDKLMTSARHILNRGRVVSAAPSTVGNREHRSPAGHHHAAHSARPSGSSSDDPELPQARRCARPGCSNSLEGLNPRRTTCSDPCRQWHYDERKRQDREPQEPLEVLALHAVALPLVELGELEGEWALYEVIIPSPAIQRIAAQVAA